MPESSADAQAYIDGNHCNVYLMWIDMLETIELDQVQAVHDG